MPAVPDYNKYNFEGENAPLVLGLLNGARVLRINGHNADVDIASVPEDLIPQGGVYTFQTTAQSLEILSSSAADAAAGTGARTVTIRGLDANYKEIEETVTLNGVTVVALTLTYLRVNFLFIVTAGSGLVNAGTITCRVVAAGATLSVIEIGFSLSHQGIYTVPAYHSLVLRSILTSSNNASGSANLLIQTREGITNAAFITRAMAIIWGFQSAPAEFATGFLVTEKSDLRFRIVSSQQDNTELAATFGAILFRTGDDGL